MLGSVCFALVLEVFDGIVIGILRGRWGRDRTLVLVG